MIKSLDKTILTTYSDGTKCAQFIKDLADTNNMTWTDVYWRAKYLYEFSGELCDVSELINYINESFNQGLSVNVDKDCYIDARRMLADLYIKVEQYEFAANCIQVVLDITEDVPVEMFLNLNYAEIHTDTLRQIMKNATMFFNDLHMADGINESLTKRQHEVIKKFLLKAAEYKSKYPDTQINNDLIEREINAFGLSTTEEWDYYKQMIGAVSSGGKKPDPILTPTKTTEPKKKSEPKETVSSTSKTKKKDRPIEIPIFPEDIPTEVVTSDEVKAEEKVETKPKKKSPAKKSPDEMAALKQMLESIAGLVGQNAQQIAELQGKLASSKDESETAKIEAELEEGKNKNKELLAQLESAQAKLAMSEEEKAEMAKVIAEQTAILDEKKSVEFTDTELEIISKFNRIVLFDTCSIENQLDLLDYMLDSEMVRVPKTVVDELENHKKNRMDSERQKAGQRGMKAIRSKKQSEAFDFEDDYPSLLPEAFKIQEDDERGTVNDKLIFSAALRYKKFTKVPVVLISDDVSVQVMAKAEHIDSMTAAEFIDGREKVLPIENAEPLTEEVFLGLKIKTKAYGLNPKEVIVLQQNGVLTYGDFLSKSEDELSYMKAKNGLSFGARFAIVHKKMKADFDRKFREETPETTEVE